MPKHSTSRRFQNDYTLGNDIGDLTHVDIQTALLFDIRRAVEDTKANAETARIVAESQLRMLRRLDRRLAKRIKLR